MSTSEGPPPLPPRTTPPPLPPAAPKSLDDLGYFSPTIEAALRLRQPKGTPEQMLAMLKKEGAKEGEIEATGLNSFIAGKKSVTQDEIMRHLDGNRVRLNETAYGAYGNPLAAEVRAYAQANGYSSSGADGVVNSVVQLAAENNRTALDRHPAFKTDEGKRLAGSLFDTVKTKWSDYSLDPSNPTYRETVLHLPSNNGNVAARVKAGEVTPDNYSALYEAQKAAPDFQSGHFPEPNIVGHMMTSMTRHEGKPVFTIDQIQSDWGQALRDTLDPAKAVGLRSRLSEMGVSENAADITRMYSTQDDAVGYAKAGARHYGTDQAKSAVAELQKLTPQQFSEVQRVAAELKQINDQMVAPIARHPLVNTTDQWTNTTLRRALRQAVNADAEYVAIPTGDTVLSYNPGDEHGMHGFYGKLVRDDAGDGYGWKPEKEGIVPKNMRKLLRTIDKEAPAPTYTDTLDSPSGKTHLGDGFTLFRITPKIRQAVKQQGQPLFSFAGPNPIPGASLQEPRSVEDILQSYSPKD